MRRYPGPFAFYGEVIGEENAQPGARTGVGLVQSQRIVEVTDVGEHTQLDSAGLLSPSLRDDRHSRKKSERELTHHASSNC